MITHVNNDGEGKLHYQQDLKFDIEVGCMEVDTSVAPDVVLVRTRLALEVPPQRSYDEMFLRSLEAVETRWPGRCIMPFEWIPAPQFWPLTTAFLVDRGMTNMVLRPETEAMLVAAGYTAFM